MGRLRLCKRSLRGPYIPADDQPFNRAPPGKYALGAYPQRFVLAPGRYAMTRRLTFHLALSIAINRSPLTGGQISGAIRFR